MLARVNPLRTLTWRRLLQTRATSFLEWLESTGKRFEITGLPEARMVIVELFGC
jgi:hypothetical protein